MIPSCPYCGHHDRAIQVDDPNGRFFCACGSLFNGGDREWHSLAEHRRYAIERRHGGTKQAGADHVFEEAS